MIQIKDVGNNRLKINYTTGDTFKFAIADDSGVQNGTTLRFQISPDGERGTMLISRIYSANGDTFTVSLTTAEAAQLLPGHTYDYRLTFISAAGEVLTTISGLLDVIWGV